MIEAVIFDMDGLMVDTEPLSRQAWDMALRPFGHSLDDTTYSRMVGLRGMKVCKLCGKRLTCP
jgi:beta-phosphoglucomutase-like phosphatase (HAD superfamily)